MRFTLPKEIKQKWLDALRSGQYEQGHGKLKTDDGKYCCLGVLQHCLDGQCESASIPSLDWAKAHGLVCEMSRYWSPVVAYRGTKYVALWWLNDRELLSFPTIADIIEAQCEGV